MIRFCLSLATLCIINAGPSLAALSGFYTSAEQVNLILSNAEVGDALRQAPIGMISNSGTRKDGAHEWTITTQDCDLKVYLIETKPTGPGKSTFKLDKIGRCE